MKGKHHEFGVRRLAARERRRLTGLFKEVKSSPDGGVPRTKQQVAAPHDDSEAHARMSMSNSLITYLYLILVDHTILQER
jgi:hypothetical protein